MPLLQSYECCTKFLRSPSLPYRHLFYVFFNITDVAAVEEIISQLYLISDCLYDDGTLR